MSNLKNFDVIKEELRAFLEEEFQKIEELIKATSVQVSDENTYKKLDELSDVQFLNRFLKEKHAEDIEFPEFDTVSMLRDS